MPQPTPKPQPRTGAVTSHRATATSAITAKIERSSLGTADARAMRARTSSAAARAVVARAAAIPHRATGKISSHKRTGGKTGRGSGG